jgi:YgiT-type zinc finger domain-containing protein
MEKNVTNLPYRLSEKKLVVLVDVPALVCEQCGDEYIEIDVVRRVEKVLERVQADGISMGFVEYALAA